MLGYGEPAEWPRRSQHDNSINDVPLRSPLSPSIDAVCRDLYLLSTAERQACANFSKDHRQVGLLRVAEG